MSRDVEKMSIGHEATLRDALEAIDRGGSGVALVVDAGRRLVGIVTDGDARRAILHGAALASPASDHMTREPETLPEGASVAVLRSRLRERGVNQIPVVDRERRVVDVAVARDLAQIPLSSPDIGQAEVDAVLEVLATPTLSLGPRLPAFERAFAEYVGTRHAVAVNSGTSGLHLAVRGLGIGEGDEVITTPFSFVASANCVLYERARPVFVDVEPETLNIDPARIEAAIGPRTRAILPVHVFGHPCDMTAVEEIARRRGLRVIEDACEAIGARVGGRMAGTLGDVAVFAFYPNKQMTTGEGGMIVTDAEDLARLCRSMRNQGRGEGGGWLAHERVGFNYRLPEIECALGTVQLARIESILERRAAVARMWEKRLSGLDALVLPRELPGYRRSWFVYVVRLADRYEQADRDRILAGLREAGVGASNYFPPIHLQPFYRKEFGFREGDFPVTEAAAKRTIALPFFNTLDEERIDQAARVLERLL